MIDVISTHMSLDKTYHMGTNNSKGWRWKFNPALFWKKSQNDFITALIAVTV